MRPRKLPIVETSRARFSNRWKWLPALVVLLATLRAEAGQLEKEFVAPPDAARPWAYWFWINGNISREGITADLEALKRVGIAGVLLMECGTAGPGGGEMAPKGPYPFGSPEWRGLFRNAVQEAARLGLEFNMNNDAGWCGSGGPWNTPEHSMQRVVWTETRVEGERRFEGVLPQPATAEGFYRDIAVLALPAEDVGEAVSSFRSSSEPSGFDGRGLLNSDRSSVVPMPWSDGVTQHWVQVEFARPVAARSMELVLGGCHAQLRVQVQASDDGQTFRSAGSFLTNPSGFFVFEPETARIWRFTFPKSDSRDTQLDVHVLKLSSRYRMSDLDAKSALVRRDVGWPPADKPAELAVARDRIVNLTGRMDKDGRLVWDIPPGSWTVLRFGHTSTGRRNHPAPEAGCGLECDKLSAEAMDAHFDGFLKRLIDDVGPAAGRALTYTHIDSWEVGSQNWTPKFGDEFRRRRGYDPLPWLPALTGRTVGSLDLSERFLWDVRATVGELVADNYAGRLRELARRHGMKLSIEAYGDGVFDNLAYAGRCDMPMGEFWVGGNAVECKAMASAGHVYGRRYIGAEAFTADEPLARWQNHPNAFKALGDRMFCAGINRFVICFMTHQPWSDRVPGMTLGRWGEHFDRSNTWWEYSKPWMDYLTRCQSLLQRGDFVADLCYLVGEGAPNTLRGLNPPPPSGYDYDACTAEVLMQATVRHGRLKLPGGMSYHVLVLPPVDRMTPPLLRKIGQLAEAGAAVVGTTRPLCSPSLENYPRCDQDVQRLAGQLPIWDRSLTEVLSAADLKPDFEGPSLGYIHRRDGDAEIYFVANPHDRPAKTECTFRVSGKLPERWDPATGDIRRAPGIATADGRTTVPLELEPRGSVFVVFRRNGRSSEVPVQRSESRAQELAGLWEVSFDPRFGGPAQPVRFEKLEDWSRRPEEGIKFYSGVAVYRKIFDLPEGTRVEGRGEDAISTAPLDPRPSTPSPRLFLDLGRVEVIAQVTLNGRDLGVLWKPPFRVDITDAVRAGDNALEIKVVNTWVNRLIGDEWLPADSEWRGNGLANWPPWLLEGKPSPTGRRTFSTYRHWTKDAPLSSSGLIGPVTLRVASE
jgi:hypothetical protein